jgi:hypothetical protein
MTSHRIEGDFPGEHLDDQELLITRLIPGETTQAFLTTRYVPAATKVENIRNKYLNLPQLKESMYVLASPVIPLLNCCLNTVRRARFT